MIFVNVFYIAELVDSQKLEEKKSDLDLVKMRYLVDGTRTTCDIFEVLVYSKERGNYYIG